MGGVTRFASAYVARGGMYFHYFKIQTEILKSFFVGKLYYNGLLFACAL